MFIVCRFKAHNLNLLIDTYQLSRFKNLSHSLLGIVIASLINSYTMTRKLNKTIII